MNYYETPSGIKFILNTDLNIVGNAREFLHQLYEQVNSIFNNYFNSEIILFKKCDNIKVLVPFVVRSPTGNLNEPIKSQLFESKLDEFVKRSTIF